MGFLKTNTAIMWQLMQTAKMVDAEYWQVLWGTVSIGQRKASPALGAFGLLDFTIITARSHLVPVFILMNCLFL
jgi:hypothetical protein